MGDFFEILPFIIAIGYWLFSRGKKKEETSNTPRKRSKPERNTPNLEDILRELQGETKQEAPKPKPAPKPQMSGNDIRAERSRRRIEIKKHEEAYKDEYIHEGDHGKSLEQLRQEIILERDMHQSNEEHETIDLKQAIIYDAILNRPYE